MVISCDADNGFLALITFSAEDTDTDTDTDTGNLHTLQKDVLVDIINQELHRRSGVRFDAACLISQRNRIKTGTITLSIHYIQMEQNYGKNV